MMEPQLFWTCPSTGHPLHLEETESDTVKAVAPLVSRWNELAGEILRPFLHIPASPLLIARGKLPKVALVAAMRKLLHAVYSVAIHRRPFVANLVTAEAR